MGIVQGEVKLLDGITSEPVFNASVVIVKPPEGLGCSCGVVPPAENPSNGLGQSEPVELIQEPFKSKTIRPVNDFTASVIALGSSISTMALS